MLNYLITGGAGFIGSHLANELLKRGNVAIIDNLSTGNKENVPKKAELIVSDCNDTAVYKKLSNVKFDAIFHLAAQSSGEISFDDPVYDLRSNTESTLKVLQFALKSGCDRIIYASTMSVYGNPESDAPSKETDLIKPLSFYAVGKIASEHYLRIYEKYNIHHTSLRLFNVYGPGQNLENLRQGMVSIYLKQMISDNKIIVKGSLDRSRDCVYIDDVIKAFLLCLDNNNTIGHVFNVGSGTRTYVKDLLQTLIKLYKKDVLIEVVDSTPGDTFGIYANIDLFKKYTAYNPSVSLEKGLKNMLNWALKSSEKEQ